MVASYFKNEYAIINEELQRKANKYHRNIISIYESFVDKPSDAFFDHFPDDSKQFVQHVNGKKRSCQVVVMPHYQLDLLQYFTQENRFASLSLFDKLLICYQLANALKFLFSNHIIHRDLKLNNILVHYSPSHSRSHRGDGDDYDELQVVICDFGYAIKVNDDYKVKIARGDPLGGNVYHLAPEILSSSSSSSSPSSSLSSPSLTGSSGGQINNNNNYIEVDYSKQPTWEFGLLCFEIIFGYLPDHHRHPRYDYQSLIDDAKDCDLYDDQMNDEIARLLSPMLSFDAPDRLSFPAAYHSFIQFFSRFLSSLSSSSSSS